MSQNNKLSEKYLTLEEYKKCSLEIHIDFWNPFFLKKMDVHYQAASNEELERIREHSISSESAFVRSSAWSHYKSPTVSQIDKGIRDESEKVRMAVIGNKNCVLSEEHINYIFKTEKSDNVFSELWDRRDWIPTEEQVEYAFFNPGHWAIKSVAGNNKYELTSERLDFLIEHPSAREAIWQRDDWVPSEEQIDYVLRIVHDPVILDLIDSRKDWERTPYLVEKGLANEYTLDSNYWEPYRHVFEAKQLKDKVGLPTDSFSHPGKVL